MSKSRIMGAGNAGASQFINLNGPQGGGSKKQGAPSTIGRITGIDYARSYGNNRDVVFFMNQLGGVGRGKSMFSPSADGVRKPKNIDTAQTDPGGELPGGELPGGELPGGELPGGELQTILETSTRTKEDQAQQVQRITEALNNQPTVGDMQTAITQLQTAISNALQPGGPGGPGAPRGQIPQLVTRPEFRNVQPVNNVSDRADLPVMS